MPSTIAWLDTTAEQQRIAREMVSLFMQSDSRDELGIAQIRDVFSNWLFPGTSVLQARARYFVLIPWCYEVAEERAGRVRSKTLEQHARDVQREMIVTMQAQFRDAPGLVGKDVGKDIKTLPRDLFWGGLTTFGIRRSKVQLPRDSSRGESEATELTSLQPTTWDPNLPPRPESFPAQVPHGLDMSSHEAQWLAERMRSGHEETYLAHLLTLDPRLIEAARHYPWEVDTTAPFVALDHARRFSWVMHGASLVYNLLVARRYASVPQLNALDAEARIEHFEGRITEWANSMGPATDPNGWAVNEFVTEVATRNRHISSRTWGFVRAWIDLCQTHGPATSAASPRAAGLIRAREQRKGSKSRLGGDVRVLEAWGGASGDGALSYRWPVIRQLLLDINGGRGTREETHAHT